VVFTTHPLTSAEVKKIVEIYLYSSSGPSWPVLGRTSSLLPFISKVVVNRNTVVQRRSVYRLLRSLSEGGGISGLCSISPMAFSQMCRFTYAQVSRFSTSAAKGKTYSFLLITFNVMFKRHLHVSITQFNSLHVSHEVRI
jgi:hypothetical protein